MIATENADRVGEFSLTDARLSPIDRFMADTLYDENVGGPFGNTHIALGDAYKDTYDGDPAALSEARLGAARLQPVGDPHRHRLDQRPHGDGGPARRLGAGDLRRAGSSSWTVSRRDLAGR